jgi:exodeoxyribonuclease V alpha subunit
MTATASGASGVPADTRDGLDAGLVVDLSAASLLGVFNRAGVLAPADVHVALRLGKLGGETAETVRLAAALAVRAPRVGHVRVDLATVQATAAGELEEEIDVDSLPWPERDGWLGQLRSSPLVSVGEDGPADRPLRLIGSALYLDRYWRDEKAVATDLLERAAAGFRPASEDETTLAERLDRLFPDDVSGEQRWAAAAAVLRRLAIIAGGPGTGKTTTVARLIAAVVEEAYRSGTRPPLIALSAPTGKAAARMAEAVHECATTLEAGEDVRQRLLALDASTVHRLLQRRAGDAERFRYDRTTRLPHDIVIVDETSMLSLWLMARLTEAVRPDARLILVGDPEQLASVEAGAVLGDIVGPASNGLRMSESARATLVSATGMCQDVELPPEPSTAIGDGIVLLRANHRFGGALSDLAAAIRSGDGDATVRALSSEDPSVEWLEVEAADEETAPRIDPVRVLAIDRARRLFEAARSGDGDTALQALGRFRLLCAHRRGPVGVGSWNPRVEEWLEASIDGFAADGEWYVGRPVIVTSNDYSLRLFNGDTGVVVARETERGPGVGVVFNRAGSLVTVSPSRLADVDTVFAMTVHKAQGSEFDEVAVVLPEPSSRVLTRELLYTAVTRAKERLILVASETSVRAAVGRPIARASGLTERLWGDGVPEPERLDAGSRTVRRGPPSG